MFELQDRGEVLFSRGSLSIAISRHKQKLVEAVNQRLQLTNLRSLSEETLINDLDLEFALTEPRIFMDKRSSFSSRDGIVTYTVPFEGDPELLFYQPKSFVMHYPHAQIRDGGLRLTYSTERNSDTAIRMDNDRTLENIAKNLASVAEEIRSFNKSIRDFVSRSISARKGILGRELEIYQSIGIPAEEEAG